MTANIGKDVVTFPEFFLNNEIYNLQVDRSYLHLKCIKSWDLVPLSSLDKKISLLDVIAVEYDAGKWTVDHSGDLILNLNLFNFFGSSFSSCSVLTIKYRVKLKKYLRKLQTITLKTRNEVDCVILHEVINRELHASLKIHNIVRPKNLLVFVDPTCGKKKAELIHKRTVSPLFQSAGIKEKVVFIKCQGDAKEFIASCNLSEFDGVIAVSGDATFCEVANAVFIAEQKKQGISFDWKDIKHSKPLHYVKPSVKLGVIPAGAANMISCTTQGVSDPETATLQLICGETHSLDVCSIHDSQGKFVSFFFTSTTFGTISQIPELAKSLTMFGPFRFDVATVAVLANHGSYPCEVSFLPSNSKSPVDVGKDSSHCRHPCDICLRKDGSDGAMVSKETPNKEGYGDWKVIRGRFHMVNSFSNAMIYDKSPLGLSPSAHLADGTADLVLVHETSRSGIVSFARSLRGTSNCFDFPFVEAHRVRGFRFRPLRENKSTPDQDLHSELSPGGGKARGALPDTSLGVWSVDGEQVKGHGFTVWVHRGLADVLARGIEAD